MTLLEVLVSIGIIGLVAALTVPAVQSSRATARRVECLSNQRQLGRATEQFVATMGRYPRFHAYPLDHQGPISRMSVHVQLLPYLDEQELYNRLDLFEASSQTEPPAAEENSNAFALSHRVQTFHCPADRAPDGGNNYRACYGTSPGTHASWVRGRPRRGPLEHESLLGVFRTSTPARVTDGLSHTMLFSERVVGDGDPEYYNPWTDVAATEGPDHYFPNDAAINCAALSRVNNHYSFLGWTWLMQGYAHTGYNHILAPNAVVPDCVDEWRPRGFAEGAVTARSHHDGGVNGVLADGSARFFNQSMDLRVWRALATIQGEEMPGGGDDG